MQNYSGYWTGQMRGANLGSFVLMLQQDGDIIRGTAKFHEPALGRFEYTVQGTAGEEASFELIPSSNPSNLVLGKITAVARLQEDELVGKWRSSIGSEGVFTARREFGEESSHVSPTSQAARHQGGQALIVNYAGYWTGEFHGTNRGSFVLDVEQEGEKIRGTAKFHEPAHGRFEYAVEGISGEREASLDLTPVANPSNLTLGRLKVVARLHETNYLSGDWNSEIRERQGSFTAQRISSEVPPTPRPRAAEIAVTDRQEQMRRRETWDAEFMRLRRSAGYPWSSSVDRGLELFWKEGRAALLSDIGPEGTKNFWPRISARGYFLSALLVSSKGLLETNNESGTPWFAFGAVMNSDESEVLLAQELSRTASRGDDVGGSVTTNSFLQVSRRADEIRRSFGTDTQIAFRHMLLAMLEPPENGVTGNLVTIDREEINMARLVEAFGEQLKRNSWVDEYGERTHWAVALERLKGTTRQSLDLAEEPRALESTSAALTNSLDFRSGRFVSPRRRAGEDELCLGVKHYARVLAKLLRFPDEGEFCFAIFGHWGRGKTFLMEITEAALNEKELLSQIGAANPRSVSEDLGRVITGRFETVFFSAWRYPSRPEVWIHLYESLFQKLRGAGWWRSLAHVIRAGIERHGVGKLLGIWFALWITALPKDWLLQYLRNYLLAIESSVAILSLAFAAIFLHKFWKTKDVLETNFLKAPRHSEKLGLQATIGEDLRALLKGWIDVSIPPWQRVKHWLLFWVLIGVLTVTILIRADETLVVGLCLAAGVLIPSVIVQVAFATAAPSPSRILLVVDDLDRCPFDHLLSVVESVKLLIEDIDISRRMRVIVLVEEDILKHAIWRKYCGLAESDAAAKLGTAYDAGRIVRENCEKLFTAHLRLSALTPEEVEEVVQTFAKGTSEHAKAAPVSRAIMPALSDTTTGALAGSTAALSQSVVQPSATPARSDEFQDSTELMTEKLAPTPTTIETKLDPTIILSADEKAILREELKEAKKRLKAGLGPRAIRAFLFRYQLARLILDEVGSPVRRKEDVAELVRLMAARSLFGEDAVGSVEAPHKIREVTNQVT
jgi:hypothetical protein